MIIRKAILEDVSQLVKIIRELDWLPIFPDLEDQSVERILMEQLSRCMADDSHLVLVAQNDSREIVGYCSAHWLPYLLLTGPECYISELFVRSDHRNSGVGALLMSEMKREAVNRGCVRLMLITGSNRESYRRGFYSKQGWEERDRIRNFVFPLI
jgi:GNAT superfamily N-acetyltransferase